MSQIPKDPVMLLSFVNLKLRDHYPSLDALCEEEELDREALTDRLAALDYHYDPDQNRFM